MKGRRRKTLNAGEIEEFLSELNSNNENSNPNVNDFNDSSNKNISLENCNHFITDNSNDDDDTMEDLIRKFCKNTYNSNNDYIKINNQNAIDIAKKMHINTNYKLLPSRTIYPEQFTLPASSLESKTSLVLSLSPMITEGEKQRLFDASECEEYTRCRVEKNKMRNGNYEYYDLDINAVISIPDYENRYYAFIESKKKNNNAIDKNMNTNDILTSNDNINSDVDNVNNAISSDTILSPQPIVQKEVTASPISPALELSSSIISIAASSLATIAQTTLVSSSVLTSIIVDHKKDVDSPDIRGKANNLIDNLASELDAILANADEEIHKNQNTKDRKKRNKMRRSIISMDYLEDLSIVDDDDNDDKKLLWKSNESNSIIPTEVTTVTDCYELSSSELKGDVENAVIHNDEFTHEIVIPTDENDDEDIKKVLEVQVQDYIEQSVISHSNNDDHTDDDDSNKKLDDNNDIIDPNDVFVEENFDMNTIADDNSKKMNDKTTMNEDNIDVSNTEDNTDLIIPTINDTDLNTVENTNLIINTVNNADVVITIDNSDTNYGDNVDIDTIKTKNDPIPIIDPETYIEIDSGNINTDTSNPQITIKAVEYNEVMNNEYDTIENKAFMRLSIRFEQARWKYQWELVSYYAALQARNKYYK